MLSEQSKRDHEIATTIMHQLGRTARAMIGFNNPSCGNENGNSFLKFHFKGSRKANALCIILDNGTDTYTMRFYKVNRVHWEAHEDIKDVYAENLLTVITEHTGLDTTLGGR